MFVAAASWCVLLFGVYEAQRGFVRRCCRWPAWGYMTPMVGDACTAVALSVAAASSYVLLFGYTRYMYLALGVLSISRVFICLIA